MSTRSKSGTLKEDTGELLVAWQSYKASSSEEITLQEGDIVELLDTSDPSGPASKRLKLDPTLDVEGEQLLDNSAARHKLSVKPHRTHTSSRHSPVRTSLTARWLVRKVKGDKGQGWVPCQILQSADEPVPGSGLPGDAAFRRQAVVSELVETEQEFVKDLDYVVQKYLVCSDKDSKKIPKVVKDNFEIIFGNLKEIAEFHRTVLMEGVKYYAKEPQLLGKTFLRLERDFDKHVNYCKEEPLAQAFLDSSEVARDYFEELSQRLGDDKTISEHLKLPIQRINDYQLLLKELVRYSACLGEDNSDIQKALELMLSVPHRAQDDKFTSSIEGYRGSIHKLGRLLAHDWFSVNFGEQTKERYLFLFKARILICKVRRISEDRSVFQLKDIIRLPQVDVKDHPEDDRSFELIEKNSGQSLILTAHRDYIKDLWLKEVREFASDAEESTSDDLQVTSEPTSPPNEPVQSTKQAEPPPKPKEETKPTDIPKKTETPKQITKPLEVGKVVDKPKSAQVPKISEPPKPAEPKAVEVKVAPKQTVIEKPPQEAKIPDKSADSSKLTEVANPTPIVVKKIENPKPAVNPQQPETAKPAVSLKQPENPKPAVVSEKPEISKPVLNPKQPENPKSSVISKQSEVNPVQNPKLVENIVSATKQQSVEVSKRVDSQNIVQATQSISAAQQSQSVSVTTVQSKNHVSVVSREEKAYSGIQKSESGDFSPYRIGVQVGLATQGLEVDDDMSRKYTAYTSSSTARSEGYGDSSSYSRRSGTRSSYSSGEGLTSSKYGTESITSKYGTESALGGRYGTDSALTSKYGTDALTSKYSAEPALTSKYSTDSVISSKYGTDSGLTGTRYGDITSKYGRADLDTGSKYEESSTYARRSGTDLGDSESYSSYSRRSLKTEGRVGHDEDDGNYYSHKRSTKTSIERSGIDDDDDYSYKRKSIRTSYGDDNGTDTYVSKRRSVKSSVDEDKEIDDYVSRQKSLDEDLDPNAYLSKRRSLKSAGEGEDAESYSYSRKHKAERIETTGSSRKKSLEEDLDPSAYISKRRSQRSAGESEEIDSYSSSRKHKADRLETSESGDYKRSASTQDDEDRLARFAKYSRSSSEQAENRESSRAKNYTSDNQDITFVKSVTESAHMDAESIALRMKAKKDITSPPDERPLFTKTLSGQNIEPGQKAILEIALAETPDSLIWLKDNLAIEEKLSKRFIVTSREEHKIWRLEINDAVESDCGLYTAVATNSKGKSTCSTRVFVHKFSDEELRKPHFVVQLKDTELLEDTYLRFMIKVKGEPHPDIVFYKDGVKISQDNERVRIIKDHEEVGFYELVIPDVKPSDAGLYKCVATNSYGEASSEAKLTVTENKNVFNDLVDKDGLLPPGEKPTFSWRKDGKDFDPEERFKVLMGDDEDSLALIFQHVRPEDAGLYTCVAQTSTGHISCSAELTVQGTVHELQREPEKPKLIIEKREANVNIGGSAMLELQVKGFPKPQVKWTHEGKPVEPSGKYKFLYEDEESFSLVIKNVEATDAGKYEVTAENELGQDIREMTLNVQAPPKIKSKMQDVSVNVEEIVRMSVDVEGIPKPIIQFYKDGKEVKNAERTKIIEEGEKHTIIIEKTSLKDSGSYSVVATNDVAQVSQFWNLNVYTKPRILKKLGTHIAVSQSEQVELSVKLESEPAPEVSWFKDGQEITTDDRYFISNDGDSYILKITGAVTTDSASYKCRAKNIHGSVDDEVRVDVKCAPRVIKPLQAMTVTEHDANVTFDVKVEAFPKPTVKWYLDEMEISETRSEFTRVEADDGVQLVIKEVSSELSGQYSCKLVNDLGATETSAKLTVNCKPRIIKQLKDTSVEEGATLHLEVEVEACPEPTVKWLRNGNEVSADARIKITRDTQRQESYHLAVNLIKYEEEGEYEVVVTNSLGTVSSKSFVTVQKVTHSDAIEETEEPPKKMKIELIEEDSEECAPVESDISKKNKKLIAHIEDTVEIEEIFDDEPIIAEESIPEEPKISQGIVSEKVEIEEVECDIKVLKPKVNDESEKSKLRTATSLQKEDIEIVENAVTEEPHSIIEEKIIQKVTRGKSVQFETSEIIESENTMHEIYEKEMPKRKASRAKSFDVEKSELVENVIASQTLTENESSKTKLKRGQSAQIEDIDTVDANSGEKLPIQTEIPNKNLQRAISAQKEKIIEIEIEDGTSPRRASTQNVDRQQSQKGVREVEDEVDDEMEALLSRAQKQRSLVENVKAESGDSDAEALPSILDSNMKDKSQYESLDVSFIVRGTANPPPTATWTVDGKPIKPSSHYVLSQRGEEFKLEVKKLAPGDAGVYECVLTNPVGDVKQHAKLDIIPEGEFRKPKIKEGLQNQTIVKKNTVTLKAVIIGDPVPDVTWCFNGKEITADEFEEYKMILESEDRDIEDDLKECTFSLTIPRCERSNGGTYKIKAKNKWGEAESSAELTIVLRPEITGPEDVTVVPRNATEFTVIIQANPVPIVTWTRNDNVIEETADIQIIEDVANEKYTLRFTNVHLGDEAYYKVTAKNNLGEDSSEGRLKIRKEQEPTSERPKFITGLTDSHVEHGGEITLMVRADGLPRPDITWYLNDKPLTDIPELKMVTNSESQISSYLTITDYNEKDSGIYKVTAVNVVGDAETSAKVSMIQTPPSFSHRLIRNMDINEGEPLSLKTKITGSPKPTAKWYKDGEPIPPDDDRIITEMLPDGTVKLNIKKITPSDSGAYKLVVKNPNGETAALCAVAVTPTPQRPKFVKCIKDQNVTVGEPLKLEAEVTAYPPPEIKWFKDGLPIRPSSNIHLEHHPDGKIALVIDSVRPENAGKYTVTAVNKLGEITGDAKVETERRPTRPDFVTRLVPQNVVEGFPAKFEVKATGYPAPKITWTRNGAEIIPDGKHIKITEQPDGTSILVLDACEKNVDALTYKAIASNEAGEAETYALLTVKSSNKEDQPEERPMYLHPLKDIITDEGQPLKLEVPFTGNPIPSVQWTKDGEPIRPSDRILLTCDGRKVGLVIDKALPSDAGQYGVTITNPLGSDTTEGKASVHKVFSPPKFTQRFTDLQQLPSRDAKFVARVSGVPQPEVTWYKNGVPLHDTDKYRIKRDGDVCCLYINNAEPADEGVYKALATNKQGEDSCEAKLEVVKEIKSPQKIEPPYFLKRIGDTELYKGMTAKFTACAAGIPEPSVQWYRNDEKLYPSDRIRMEKDTAGLLRLTIAGVDQDDVGKYSCKIFNEHGEDICHAQLRFDEVEPKAKRPIVDQYTDYDKYKRSGAPMPLADPPIISRMTDRHCTLSWKPSIPSAPRAPVTYQLEMLELPSGDWFTVRTGIRSCVCGVGNLEPFKDYKFRVRVENKYGISDPSPFAVTHRQKLEPDLPKFQPYLSPGIDFRPETSPYFPRDFDIDRPPHDHMAQAPRFLRREHDTQYGVKDQNMNLFWFVYGYPKPKMTYFFNDIPIESGGRFDMSYTRNGQATLFINKMLERDVGWYEAVAKNEHGEARQRVRLEIAELPVFLRRPDIEYVMIRGKARFEARIIGVPYPEIKWYKDWKPLTTSSRIKIQFMEPDTTILVINDTIQKDEALYSVSARNVAGTVSSSAMLHVEENDLEYNIRTYNNLSPIKPRRMPFESGYDIGDELGRGTQGVTYHAVERINGRNYAAKIMHGRGDLRPFMYNELDILNQLRHKKLISLHDAYENEDSLALVMELASGGELVKDYLLKKDYYTESEIAGFIRQMLQGLQYMHERGFGHMGLNIGDLLLSHPGGDDLKICDFGLSRRVSMGRLYPLNYGVPEYVSPECANGEGTGLRHDMWSIGIITYILLSGHSPFRGANDRETLMNIQSGKWTFDESWWTNISVEARDFISKLLIYQADGRMDVHAALRHPWLEKSDKIWSDEYRISSKYLRDYFVLYREWYDNASCRRWFRRRPLEGAFTHPSRMVYPPGDRSTPPPTLPPPEHVPRKPTTWEEQIPSRSPLNYEIGVIKSESHYQNGPDTYLLQLRDVDFPVRLREYMKVAANRGPGRGYIVSDENGYDWQTPIIRERRRFTDIMDEEIDDERKARITRYGSGDTGYSIRRLRHEIGARLDTYAEAEAFIESKQDGRLPFFREKPQMVAMQEGKDLELTCFAVGDPTPIVQWFKNDAIIAESHRIKIETDDDGRSHFKLCPALSFDLGAYKVVARNKIGQTVARTRIVLGLVPDEPDSPEATQTSDTEVLLTWKQPKFDGHSPVQCYSLQYKLANETDWTEQANNIDHEFYLMTGLKPGESYNFRLAAKNSIGWSEQGVASAVVITKPTGAPKIQLSKAMSHLQQITDSGQEPEIDPYSRPNYSLESDPIDWIKENAQDHFEFISEISRGKFSAVLKAVDKRKDTVVVAKLLELSGNTEQVDGEFAAHRSLRHERIAGLIAAYRTPENPVAAFIVEKLQGADVLTYLASRHEYTEQTVATIVTQVLDGLQYLHWRGLCHLDLQPDNVVMCGVRSVQVKLVDFGCAHRVTKLGNKVPIVGHPDYMAPEVLAEEPAFPLTDIWSLGVLTYVMLSGTLPFRGEDETESRQNIIFVRYRFEHLYQEVSQEGVRFLMLVFKRHPNKRPTAEECHENRWLLPTDYMIKKRERAVFLGNRLKEYSEQYHAEKLNAVQTASTTGSLSKGLIRSHSIQEELLTAQ